MFEEEIDISVILKRSFQAALGNGSKNNLLNESELEDVSGATRKIVEDAQRLPISLYCPFCSAEYMFEFTLKDHLQKIHTEDIKKHLKEIKRLSSDSEDLNFYSCSYCNAIFYHFGLLPKHINQKHGPEFLDEWRNKNLEKFEIERENEPSINYVTCSPGLSILFDALDTCEGGVRKLKRSASTKTIDTSPQLKSILKKTNNLSGKIIFSPASASLKRTKGEIIRRSASVRRELRFDLPPLPKSPLEDSNNLLKTDIKENRKKTFMDWMMFSGKDKQQQVLSEGVSPSKMVKKNIKVKSCKYVAQTINQMVTSTPNNDLDDFLNDSGDDSIGGNWKFAIKNKFQPTFMCMERFQCNFCKATFSNNPELKAHMKQNHWKISLKPSYRCGQCGSKFYRNQFLLRHCQLQHTPVKR